MALDWGLPRIAHVLLFISRYRTKKMQLSILSRRVIYLSCCTHLASSCLLYRRACGGLVVEAMR